MNSPKVISINVGFPRTIESNGKKIRTGIFKEPVAGRVAIRTLNMEGDRQADLRVHGGIRKAVYAYPSEHYSFWREQLPDIPLPWGMFGENLTTEGLIEDSVYVGNRYRVGTAELEVTQPRMPCFKLAAKFGRNDMIKRFLHSRRTGFYLAVIKQGEAEAGDEIELIHEGPDRVTILQVVESYL
jgi:MOSC domain-containing protein YiiM